MIFDKKGKAKRKTKQKTYINVMKIIFAEDASYCLISKLLSPEITNRKPLNQLKVKINENPLDCKQIKSDICQKMESVLWHCFRCNAVTQAI